MRVPRTEEAITLHSMCQPGRPEPQGEGQLGSPGLDVFQSAKSLGLRLPEVVAEEVEREPSAWELERGMSVMTA